MPFVQRGLDATIAKVTSVVASSGLEIISISEGANVLSSVSKISKHPVQLKAEAGFQKPTAATKPFPEKMFVEKPLLEYSELSHPKIPSIVFQEIVEYAQVNSWPELVGHLKTLPEGMIFKRYAKADKTVGIEFKNINNPHDVIAFKKAKLDADYPSQRVDYVSYTKYGNKHVGMNGGSFYKKHDEIWKKCSSTQKEELYLNRKQMDTLGIKGPAYIPEVHIPIDKLQSVMEIIKNL